MKPRTSNRRTMLLFGAVLLLASPFLYALPGGNPFPKKSGGVSLQATSPGTQQTGNINVSGTVLVGDGTSSLPSVSFASQTAMGCRRGGASDFLCQANATGAYLELNGNAALLVNGGASAYINILNGGPIQMIGGVELSGNLVGTSTRIKVAGTAAVVGDFVLSAGWGDAASVGTLTGDDNHLRFTVTSAGTGQAANPTIAYTFKNGTWVTAPFCQVKFEDASTAAELNTNVATQSASATVLTITYRATAPTAARTYTFTTLCTGI